MQIEKMTSTTKSMKANDELRIAFAAANVAVSTEILELCSDLYCKHGYSSPESLVLDWETYSVNHKVTALTRNTFPGFSRSISNTGNASAPKMGAVMARTRTAYPEDEDEGLGFVTPSPKKRIRIDKKENCEEERDTCDVELHSTEGPNYSHRQGSGTVVGTFSNTTLANTTSFSVSKTNTVNTSMFSYWNISSAFRYGYTNLKERAAALDHQLCRLSSEMVSNRLPLEAVVEPVGAPQQQPAYCIGRICNEAHGGKINPSSILLEGSRHLSSGKRVSLKLDNDVSYSLFPGQIVAVHGTNPDGTAVVASKIVEGSAASKKKSSVADFSPASLNVIVAAGPFTTSDNLDYEPFGDLMLHIQLTRPDVVILAGPFVDIRHPQIQNNHIQLEMEDGSFANVTLTQMFQQRISAMIEDLYVQSLEKDGVELKTQFILLPSLDDAIAEHVYPQPPLFERQADESIVVDGMEVNTLGFHHVEVAGRIGEARGKRIHCLSNPCTFQINEVVFGITATDILYHISSNEIHDVSMENRLLRISQHLLNQQSYYPLFPTPITNDIRANLDLGKINHWRMPCTPDILILPSKLIPFAKLTSSSCLAVNPGLISKGTTGGTYASIQIYPMKKEFIDQLGDQIKIEHGVQERVNVSIRKI